MWKRAPQEIFQKRPEQYVSFVRQQHPVGTWLGSVWGHILQIHSSKRRNSNQEKKIP
jgi:hypothetical protein